MSRQHAHFELFMREQSRHESNSAHWGIFHADFNPTSQMFTETANLGAPSFISPEPLGISIERS